MYHTSSSVGIAAPIMMTSVIAYSNSLLVPESVSVALTVVIEAPPKTSSDIDWEY